MMPAPTPAVFAVGDSVHIDLHDGPAIGTVFGVAKHGRLVAVDLGEGRGAGIYFDYALTLVTRALTTTPDAAPARVITCGDIEHRVEAFNAGYHLAEQHLAGVIHDDPFDADVPAVWFFPTGMRSGGMPTTRPMIAMEGNPGTFVVHDKDGGWASYAGHHMPDDAVHLAGVDPRDPTHIPPSARIRVADAAELREVHEAINASGISSGVPVLAANGVCWWSFGQDDGDTWSLWLVAADPGECLEWETGDIPWTRWTSPEWSGLHWPMTVLWHPPTVDVRAAIRMARDGDDA